MLEEEHPGLIPGCIFVPSNRTPLVADRLLICQESSLVPMPHRSGGVVDVSLTPQERAHDLVRIDSLLIECLGIQTARTPVKVSEGQKCLDVTPSILEDIHHEFLDISVYTPHRHLPECRIDLDKLVDHRYE